MKMSFCGQVGVTLFLVALATVALAQPPVITEQPRALSVGPGDRAGFVVNASGAAPLAFQWYRGGTPVAGGTSDLLLLPAAQTTDAGDYTVRVINAEGAVTSAAAKLTVSAYTTAWADPTYQVTDTTVTEPLLLLADGGTIVTCSDQWHPLKRLNADGSVDATFSFAGHPAPSWRWQAVRMVRQEDGHTLVTGIDTGRSPGRTWVSMTLERLDADGSIDSQFTLPALPLPKLNPSVLLPTGNKVVTAWGNQLVRLMPDGSIDPTFVASVLDDPLTFGAAAFASSGNVLVGGGSSVWRLHSDGSRDDGFARTELSGTVMEIVPTTDGGCWVGTTATDTASAYQSLYRLFRLKPAGAIESGTQNFSVLATGTPAISVQPDGRVIVAGNFVLRVPTGEDGREAVHRGVVRLLPDGTVDPTFMPTGATIWGKWWVLPDGTHAISGTRRMNLATLGPIEPPRILRVSPSEVKVSAGEDVTVQVVAVGPGALQIGPGDSEVAKVSFADDALTFLDVQGDLGVTVNGLGGTAIKAIATDFYTSAPRLVETLEPVVARAGQTAVLNAKVRGSYPLDYEWLKDGTVVTSGTLNRYVLGSLTYSVGASEATAGTYTLRVTNSSGVTVNSTSLSVGAVSQLSNLSVRAQVGTGEQVMIVGFVLAHAKAVLFQAIGPELVQYGVNDALADPTTTLHLADGTTLSNDNGGVGLPGQDSIYTLTGAWPLWLYVTKSSELRPGSIDGVNTIVVSGKGGATGIALAQIFDADATTNRLVNLSARVFSGAGDANAITGFIIKGDTPKKVLIRCVGPGLAGGGVAQPMLDPNLTLVDQATHAILAKNDDWGTGVATEVAELRRVMPLVGAFPLAEGSKDAALVATLSPGEYSAVVAGAGDSTGIVLLEVYDVP